MEVQWPAKLDLFGLGVSPVDYEDTVNHVARAAKAGEPAVVSCHAVHAVVTISRDKQLLSLANDFEIITPDGQPVRWALNLLHGARLRDRVYGPELMQRLLERAANDELAIYLYGGSESSLAKLENNIRNDFAGLKIAGTHSPPFRDLTDAEMNEVAERINASGADIVFIGLGCPKQDAFAAAQKHRIKGVQICVGAAFDFHAGTKPMAPRWMQASGLEWLYRLYCEPQRLLRRYFETNTLFLIYLFKALLLKILGVSPLDHSKNNDMPSKSCLKSNTRVI